MERQGQKTNQFTFKMTAPKTTVFALDTFAPINENLAIILAIPFALPDPDPDPQTTQTPRQTRPPRGGADWAGGLPRGRGASAAPAPLAAAGGCLGVPRGVPCSSRRVADDRTAFDVPGPGRRLIAREREVKSDQTRAPSGRGAWSLELRNFTSKGQQDLSYLRAYPPPRPTPRARTWRVGSTRTGFNVAFEDLTLGTPRPERP